MGKGIQSHKQRSNLQSNLPQLQHVARKDPISYREEFEQQYRHYLSLLEVYKLQPNHGSKELNTLIIFIAQLAQYYRDVVSDFPMQLRDLLKNNYTVMDPDTRMCICKSLVMLRRKQLISPTSLLEYFFGLLSCQDKSLRKMLFTYIVGDIKQINKHHKDVRLNSTLQNLMYSMLEHNNSTAARLSLDVMCELYRRGVWHDAKTVNVVSTACFSAISKLMSAAVTFFLTDGKKEKKDGDDESSDEEDNDDGDDKKTARELLMAHRVGKKTKKRQRKMRRALAVVKRDASKRGGGKESGLANFSALYLIHDPQGFAEKLLKQVEARRERFEMRVKIMSLISRLIAVHELSLINFYPYLQRFLQPHQKDVLEFLVFAAQSVHPLVPPDVVHPLLYTIANNFISERNTTECMAVGINTVREMCSRHPSIMNEDLLQDLVQYKSYRDKNVSVAARSLVTLYRLNNPELLTRKNKGKPTDHTKELEVMQYGEIKAKDFVAGADVLEEKDNNDSGDGDDDEWESASDDGDGDDEDGWVDVSHSDDDDGVSDAGNDSNDVMTTVEKAVKSSKISQSRFISQDEFKKIKIAQMRKQIELSKPRFDKDKKRAASDDINLDSDDDGKGDPNLVQVSKITRLSKKRKMEREERIAHNKEGKDDKPKFGRREKKHKTKKGNTNKEKMRNKNFIMLKPKLKFKAGKRSFRDKQIALRNSLIKRQKNFK